MQLRSNLIPATNADNPLLGTQYRAPVDISGHTHGYIDTLKMLSRGDRSQKTEVNIHVQNVTRTWKNVDRNVDRERAWTLDGGDINTS